MRPVRRFGGRIAQEASGLDRIIPLLKTRKNSAQFSLNGHFTCHNHGASMKESSDEWILKRRHEDLSLTVRASWSLYIQFYTKSSVYESQNTSLQVRGILRRIDSSVCHVNEVATPLNRSNKNFSSSRHIFEASSRSSTFEPWVSLPIRGRHHG